MRRSITIAILILTQALAGAIGAPAVADTAGTTHSGTSFLVRLASTVNLPPNGTPLVRTGLAQVDAALDATGATTLSPVVRDAGASGGDFARRSGLDRTYVVQVPEGSDVRRIVSAFHGLEGVDYAEPNLWVFPAAVIPDDPAFPEQWALDRLRYPEAWEATTGGTVILTFIDSGVSATHVDMAGKIVAGWDFRDGDDDPEDQTSHGTATSSIALANTDNGMDIAAACWNCRLMPLKIWDATNSGAATIAEAADALGWAVDHGARIVNLSGGYAEDSMTFRSAVEQAYANGVIFVAPTHNGNTDMITYPARYPQTIAVGGTDMLDQRAVDICGVAPGSNWGPEVDVVAPATWVAAVNFAGGWGLACGTSMSSPLVAGLAGLVRSVLPSIGREEFRHLLQSAARDQVGRPGEDLPGRDDHHGWGLVDAYATIAGAVDAKSLRVDGGTATRLTYRIPAFAGSADFIRGDPAALTESEMGVDLGEVVCLESDSTDGDTAGSEDDEDPQPGRAFFYLARYGAAPGAGSWGGSTQNRDRFATAGSCAR